KKKGAKKQQKKSAKKAKGTLPLKKKTAVKTAPKSVKAKPGKKASKTIDKKTLKPLKEKKIVVHAESKESIEKAQITKRVRKSSKKAAIVLPPPPVIEVSNLPKSKVRSILVSQPKPAENDKNPYLDL